MERIRQAIEKARESRSAISARSSGHTAQPLEENSAAWDALETFTPTMKLLARNRVVTVDTANPAHVPYDKMRTRLLSACRKNGWRVIGITSPTARCGKTLTSVNLAFSLSRQRSVRTVLMDADLRAPGVAPTIGLTYARTSVSQFLMGEGRVEDHFLRFGAALAVSVETAPARNSAEILMSATAAESMDLVLRTLEPEVLIVDLPPMRVADDVMAFLPNIDCVLLVAAAEETKMAEIDRCERELGAHTNVMGVVVNKCRYTPEEYGY